MWELLFDNWRNSRVQLNPGASQEQLLQLEKRLGVLLPESFKLFYKCCNGFGDGPPTMDDDLIRIWPVDEIQSMCSCLSLEHDSAEASKLDNLFVFADYSICAALIAIELHQTHRCDGPVFIWYTEPILVDPSFQQFIDRYERGDTKWIYE